MEEKHRQSIIEPHQGKAYSPLKELLRSQKEKKRKPQQDPCPKPKEKSSNREELVTEKKDAASRRILHLPEEQWEKIVPFFNHSGNAKSVFLHLPIK
jgi:hypothetical protein